MRARTWSLPPDEIAVAGGRATLSGRYLVWVHTQACRAARFAPFKARVDKYAVKPLGLGLMLHKAATRNDNCPFDISCLFTALQYSSSGAQIFNPAVGATANSALQYLS